MERKANQQPCCNTVAIKAKCNALYEFRKKEWRGFDGNFETFATLQDEVKKEYDYLRSFWQKNEYGEIDHIIDEKFIPWNITNRINVIVHPVPNIIKSIGVKKPNISLDFLVFAGIK